MQSSKYSDKVFDLGVLPAITKGSRLLRHLTLIRSCALIIVKGLSSIGYLLDRNFGPPPSVLHDS